MRSFVVLGALALMIHFRAEIRTQIESWTTPEENVHVEAAIDLRCDSEPIPLRDDCARDLHADLVSGTIEAETIIRRHCTRITSQWALEPQRPPSPICRELYGGWIRG